MTEPGAGGPRPVLAALEIADPAEAWAALGFTVADGGIELGGVQASLGASGDGITSWSIRGIKPTTIDGLRFGPLPGPSSGQVPVAVHPNGAVGLDHVVVVTPDFERTVTALETSGIALSRVRDAGGFRQGFRRLGPAILELVEVRGAQERPARFWGLVVIVEDLEALAARLGDRLGTIKAAVQPGRRIATLRDGIGPSPKVAFMTPEER